MQAKSITKTPTFNQGEKNRGWRIGQRPQGKREGWVFQRT